MRIKTILFCTVCLLATLLVGCTRDTVPHVPPEVLPESVPDSQDLTAGGKTGHDKIPVVPDFAEDPGPPAPQFPLYYFGAPLEESEPVEDDNFFDSAAFLGDSRTEGLQLWGGIHTGDYYWKRGITVFEADSEDFTFEVDGEELTMLGALEKKQYDTIYIMIGINELGYTAKEYEEGLGALLDRIMALQPDAVIYLQTLPPINDELAIEHLEEHHRNANIDAFNEAIGRIASEKRVVLLDTAAVYRGEDGQLPAEMTGDGCHFNSAYYALWADYLRCHVIDPDRYAYCRSLDPAPVLETAPASGEEAAP